LNVFVHRAINIVAGSIQRQSDLASTLTPSATKLSYFVVNIKNVKGIYTNQR